MLPLRKQLANRASRMQKGTRVQGRQKGLQLQTLLRMMKASKA